MGYEYNLIVLDNNDLTRLEEFRNRIYNSIRNTLTVWKQIEHYLNNVEDFYNTFNYILKYRRGGECPFLSLLRIIYEVIYPRGIMLLPENVDLEKIIDKLERRCPRPGFYRRLTTHSTSYVMFSESTRVFANYYQLCNLPILIRLFHPNEIESTISDILYRLGSCTLSTSIVGIVLPREVTYAQYGIDRPLFVLHRNFFPEVIRPSIYSRYIIDIVPEATHPRYTQFDYTLMMELVDYLEIFTS